jgi:hypothetical protein
VVVAATGIERVPLLFGSPKVSILGRGNKPESGASETCLVAWEAIFPHNTPGVAATAISHECREMTAWLARALVIASFAVVVAPSALAENPTFGEMLARAEAQAAAGRRWAPPGDNMTETISGMMDIISTATPQQLAELSALLESDGSRPAAGERPQGGRPVPQPAVVATTTEPNRPAPGPVVTKTEPDQPVLGPAVTMTEPDRPVPGPAVTMAQPDRPGPAAAVTMTQPDRPVPGPGVTMTQPDRPVPGPAVTMAQPDRLVPKSAAPMPPPPHPGSRAAELLARGQEAERLGDVSGARRFYISAAQQGSAAAARNLGRLYDPIYLTQTALGGIDPDVALARRWYERAVAMGDPVAGPLLEALALR